jgi:hypothetical protein
MPDVGQKLHTMSEWIKSIRKLSNSRIHHLSGKMRIIYPSVFKKPEVVNILRRLHDKFVLVPADKSSNNIVFVCKKYYSEFTSTSGNPPILQPIFQRMKFFKIIFLF